MTSFLIVLRIVCVSLAAYICFVFWTLYRIYYPARCPSDANWCISNYLFNTSQPLLKLWVYSSTSSIGLSGNDLFLVYELNDFNPNESFTKDVSVRIPLGMHSNGTMFAHWFIAEGGRGYESPFEAGWYMYAMPTTLLTIRTNPQATTLQTVSAKNVTREKPEAGDQLTGRWRPCLTFNFMTDDVVFDRESFPGFLDGRLYWIPSLQKRRYMPLFVDDQICNRTKDLLPLNNTCHEMPLTVSSRPVSYVEFGLRMLVQKRLLGIKSVTTEKEIKDLKEATITNRPGFFLQWILSLFYLLFVLLAYERDIRFWQERQTMCGLSKQTVVWRSVSIVVNFLYMMDSQTNIRRIIAFGILSIVEIWKVCRVFRARVSFTEWRMVFDNDAAGNKELQTQAFDAQAMRYLSWVLYPSWVAVIIYTLVYNFQESWYSLFILILVNGFQCFEFLFALPQVFINYKLKSVSDLPWMALMFRYFAAATRDTCQISIRKPIDYFGASYTDQLIFVIYIQQRGWYLR